MVAPNSPSPRANDSSVPVMMPGSASGSVIDAKTHEARAAQRSRRDLEPPVDGRDRQADRADHERKAHDGGGQRRAGPAERERRSRTTRRARCRSAPRLPNSTRSAKPTTTGGSTSGRCTIASTSVLPGKFEPREAIGDENRERQAADDADGRDARLSARMPSSSEVSPNMRLLAQSRSRTSPRPDAPARSEGSRAAAWPRRTCSPSTRAAG